MHTEISLNVNGLNLAGKAWGPEDGMPVLGLHGWLDNAATFDRLVHLLPKSLRLISLDLPGHGHSDHMVGYRTYHFVDWIPIVFDVADRLNWERFSILGHSMGGAIAAMAAGACAERIDRCVIIDALGPWTAPSELAPAKLREAISQRRILRAKRSRRFDSVADAVALLNESYKDLTAEQVAILVERGLCAHEEDGFRFRYDMMLRAASPMYWVEDQVLAFLRAIESPLLLIRPRDGWPVDETMASERIGAVRSLKLAAIEGGHHVHLSHPERVAKAMEGFWD